MKSSNVSVSARAPAAGIPPCRARCGGRLPGWPSPPSNSQMCCEQPLGPFGSVRGHWSVSTSGTAGPDLGALDRVVVEEDEAVEPEVEPRREGAEVLRTWAAS